MMTCIALVAGEASGDLLGAGLVKALSERYPDAEFFGIAGPQMQQAGCRSLFPMEKLSVMGLLEVLKHLPDLLRLRKQLYQTILEKKPDVFIGIDAPDFNLALEKKLKKKGIKTVHYVSPSVWAWREWRVKKIANAADTVLTLFPFEVDFYNKHQVDARFVGHPLADTIPLQSDKLKARSEFGLNEEDKVLAILPGSRMGELERLAEIFIQVAQKCHVSIPGLKFLVPMVNDKTAAYFEARLKHYQLPFDIQLIRGQSRDVMQASDAVLLASGTAALEAMLLKRPMIVAYRLSALTYFILKFFKILKVSYYSLPNHLAGKMIVQEFMQNNATVDNITPALIKLLSDKEAINALQNQFMDIHNSLKKDASQQAADEVAKLIGREADG